MLYIEYPKCSTCKRAKKWLETNKLEFEARDIVINNPTFEELSRWMIQSELPVKKFFNTSGLVYREMKLKEQLKDMSEQEQIELLATNGMLVKRPLLIDEKKGIVLVGFKEVEWMKLLS